MFQTISPFAIKYNLPINSKYNADENEKIAKSVFKREGIVLMVWEHSAINSLTATLGVDDTPQWDNSDFDSIWIINYQDGKAKLSVDKEGINPSEECSY
jgi:Tol biopolymer transport system component